MEHFCMFYDKKEHCYYGTYEINWTDETRHFEMMNKCTTITPSEFQLEEEELNRMIDMNIRAVEKLKTLTSFDDVVFEQTTETEPIEVTRFYLPKIHMHFEMWEHKYGSKAEVILTGSLFDSFLDGEGFNNQVKIFRILDEKQLRFIYDEIMKQKR